MLLRNSLGVVVLSVDTITTVYQWHSRPLDRARKNSRNEKKIIKKSQKDIRAKS